MTLETFHHMRDLSTGAIQNVENICYVEKLSCFVAKSVLLQFTLFCREICFVAIYALLCGEKFNQKLCLWRKKDKYQVWATIINLINDLHWCDCNVESLF